MTTIVNKEPGGKVVWHRWFPLGFFAVVLSTGSLSVAASSEASSLVRGAIDRLRTHDGIIFLLALAVIVPFLTVVHSKRPWAMETTVLAMGLAVVLAVVTGGSVAWRQNTLSGFPTDLPGTHALHDLAISAPNKNISQVWPAFTGIKIAVGDARVIVPRNLVWLSYLQEVAEVEVIEDGDYEASDVPWARVEAGSVEFVSELGADQMLFVIDDVVTYRWFEATDVVYLVPEP